VAYRILIADDATMNRMLVKKVLSQNLENSVFEEAVNGQEVLEIVEKIPVDLMIIDIIMPVMDGYETIANIRKNHKHKNLPIIALTAKAMKDDRSKCINAGANDYITKPVNIEKLLTLMRVWLYA